MPTYNELLAAWEREQNPEVNPADIPGAYRPVNKDFTNTGVAQYQEEQDWIDKYFAEYGVRPSLAEANEFIRGQDVTKLTYNPASTMGEMGFKTWDDYWKAQQMNEPYGPFAGAQVPAGGYVISEPDKPLWRTYSKPKAASYLERGQVAGYDPRTGKQFYEANDPTAAQYYNQPPGIPRPYQAGEPFKGMSVEEALSQATPYDRYKAQVSDYLNQQVKAGDTLGVDVSNMTDEERASAVLAKANAAIDTATEMMSRGELVGRLPFYQESRMSKGVEVANLWQTLNQNAEATAKGAEAQRLKEYNTQYYKTSPTPPSYPWGEPPPAALRAKPTMQEETDYGNFITSFDGQPKLQAWLDSNYSNLWNLWSEGGQQGKFMDWLIGYLSRGGKPQIEEAPIRSSGALTPATHLVR